MTNFTNERLGFLAGTYDGPRIVKELAAALLAERKAREMEVAEWKANTIAFLGPWAVEYARNSDYPDGHIHHIHYDLLKKAGARLVSFTRHELQKDQLHD